MDNSPALSVSSQVRTFLTTIAEGATFANRDVALALGFPPNQHIMGAISACMTGLVKAGNLTATRAARRPGQNGGVHYHYTLIKCPENPVTLARTRITKRFSERAPREEVAIGQEREAISKTLFDLALYMEVAERTPSLTSATIPQLLEEFARRFKEGKA